MILEELASYAFIRRPTFRLQRLSGNGPQHAQSDNLGEVGKTYAAEPMTCHEPRASLCPVP